jgi:hypothetical protein
MIIIPIAKEELDKIDKMFWDVALGYNRLSSLLIMLISLIGILWLGIRGLFNNAEWIYKNISYWQSVFISSAYFIGNILFSIWLGDLWDKQRSKK